MGYIISNHARPWLVPGYISTSVLVSDTASFAQGGKIPELIRSKRAASGFVGVDFHEGKWRARVRIGVGIRGQPNRLVIGRYPTAGEAAIAYAR